MTQRKVAPNQHVRTRRDHATELAEDYVEAVAEIIQQRGTCRVTDLAVRFAVSHVSVNRAVARLRRDGFAVSERYGPIELTAAGKRLAKAARDRHDIVYRFLRALGVSEPAALGDAEGIEHHVSAETLHAMKVFVTKQGG